MRLKAEAARRLRAAMSDGGLVFGHRRTWELARWHAFLSVAKNETFARSAHPMLVGSLRIMGERAFGAVFRPLVHNIFVAGDTRKEVLATMARMRDLGLKPLLSPMLEDDGSEMSEEERSRVHTANLDIIFDCIDVWRDPQLNDVSPKTLAIKISAFLSAKILAKFAEATSTMDYEALVNHVESLISHAAAPPVFDLKEIPGLAADEAELFLLACRHLHNIAAEVEKRGALLFIDAEQSDIQPAERVLSVAMMKKFNTAGRTTVACTYQCYLRDAARCVEEDVRLARKHGFTLGCKLVRGAYLASEAKRTPCPIMPSYEATNASYNSIMCDLIRRRNDGAGILVVVATHNAESTLLACDQLEEEGGAAKVHFAQIAGMADHLSIGLARSGLSSLKLVPRGSVSSVLPWLARRIEENGEAVRRSSADTTDMIRRELANRLLHPFRQRHK